MAPPEEMPRPFACGLLSVAVPGAGQICAGRRRRGLLIIALALSAGVLAGWYAWREEAALAESVVQLDVLLALGRPVLVGFSRKSSLGRVLGDPHATTGPLSASLAAAVAAYQRGASILRVHDVRETVEALAVAKAALP